MDQQWRLKRIYHLNPTIGFVGKAFVGKASAENSRPTSPHCELVDRLFSEAEAFQTKSRKQKIPSIEP